MIVRELLAKFGVQYDDSGAKKADKAVGGLKAGLGELLGIVGGAALVRGMARFVVQQVQLADAVGDTAERLGIGVEALQELRFAGEDVGMSMEGVDAALGRLVRGSAEAARGQGEASDAFRELGVSLKDGHGNLRSFDDILGQVADGLGNTGTDADRLRIAYKLFGREGTKFAATMKNGAAGIEQMRARARELGGVLSQDQVDAADKADKAINGFRFALSGVKQEIAARFLPSLTNGLQQLTRWTGAIRQMTRNSNIVVGALGAVGVALATLIGASRLMQLAKAGVAFAVIALAIDDIVTWARGGDSVIGDLLNAFGGAGTSAEALKGLKDAAEGALLAVKDLGKFQKFLDEDFFGAAGSGQGFDWLAMQVNRAHRGIAQFLNLLRRFQGWSPGTAASGGSRVVGEDYEVPALMEPFSRTYGQGIDADQRMPGADSVPRAQGQGVNAGLAAAGRAEHQGMPYGGLPAAFATAPNMTPAAGPVVNLQQHVTVNVEGGGDARELAAMFEAKLKKTMTEQNAETMRAVQQVTR